MGLPPHTSIEMPNVVNISTITVEGIGEFQCVEVGPGLWNWTTPGFSWQFNEKTAPPHANTAMYVDGKYHFQLRTRTMREACIYTMGFSYGYKNGFVQGKADADGAAEMHRQVFREALEKDKQLPPVKADNGIT